MVKKTMSNKKNYVINFEKFFELITKKNQNEKNNDSTITEIWQPDANGDLKIANKELVDNKYDANNHLCSLRYDFINSLINQVLSVYSTPEGAILKEEKQMSFGQKIIFDTFVKEGIIYEIK
jgi:hypothetical protein